MVRLERAGGGTEEATFRYVIGCDGAHSTVRHALGIAFEGDAMPMTFMLGDVRVPLGSAAWPGAARGASGRERGA